MYRFRDRKFRVSTLAAVLVGAALAGWSPVGTAPARAADLKVYSPIVEKGEVAFEARGNVAFDDHADRDGAQNQRYEVEYTPTDYWHTALVGEFDKEAEGSLKYAATAWENIFQLFPQGKYWLDLGLYVEYEAAHQSGSPNALEWKILAEKSFGRLTFTVNPIFENELGSNAHKSTEFRYAARLKWRLMPRFEPAVEAYGDIGEISNTDPASEQRHQIGPVALGKLGLGGTDAIRYEAGYLFGLTRDGSPDGAFKWLVEFEHRF